MKFKINTDANKTKSVLMMSLMLLSFNFLLSCAKGSDDSKAAPAAACPSGSSYQSGACVNAYGQIVSSASFTYNNGFFADNHSGRSRLRIVNPAKMKEFFRNAMGTCDRSHIAGGQASCDYYVSGKMDIIIQFPNLNSAATSLLATFIAAPRINPYFNYSYSLPSGRGLIGIAAGLLTGIYLPDPKQYYGAYRNPLSVEMPISVINNSTGFSANGYGDAWSGMNTTKLTIKVPKGKTTDWRLDYFTFNVGDVPAAEGTFIRCQYLNCGFN